MNFFCTLAHLWFLFACLFVVVRFFLQDSFFQRTYSVAVVFVFMCFVCGFLHQNLKWISTVFHIFAPEGIMWKFLIVNEHRALIWQHKQVYDFFFWFFSLFFLLLVFFLSFCVFTRHFSMQFVHFLSCVTHLKSCDVYDFCHNLMFWCWIFHFNFDLCVNI